MTLSLSQPDLNNIVADEEVDDAYTDTLMTALGTKQPSIAWDSRRRIVEFEVLANALASCTNSLQLSHATSIGPYGHAFQR